MEKTMATQTDIGNLGAADNACKLAMQKLPDVGNLAG